VSETDTTHVPHVEADPLAAGSAGDRVIRGSGLRAAAHVVGVLVGAVSAPLVVRHLGPTRYGEFATVGSVMFVTAGLTEGGLANVATRRYSTSDLAGKRQVIANLAGLRILLGLLGGAGALVFGFIAGYPGVMLAGLALGSSTLLFTGLQGALNTSLTADLRLPAVAAIDLLRSLITTAFFLMLVLLGAGLFGFFTVAGSVALVTWVATCVLIRKRMPVAPAFDRAVWRSLARETALYAAATALGVVYFQIALVAMSLLSSGHETGYYAAAFRIVDLANGVPWLLAGSSFPVLAHAAANDPERMRYVLGRTTQTALLIGGLVAMVILLGARFGIKVVGGAEFAPSASALRILSAGVWATYLTAIWSFALLSLQRYRSMVIANGLSLVLAITLSVILIPAAGADGGAITTAVLELFLAGANGFLLFRARPDLRPGASVLPRLALALVAGLGVGGALLAVHDVVAVAGGSLTYIGMLFALRAVPPELLEAVRRRRAT
jgi:O-antigen/teichoic acid export membrane protein